MVKRYLKILIAILLLCFVFGFSDIKQNDEYSCAPVCAANCVINILNQKLSETELIKTLAQDAHTDKNGTTANNLILAVEKYLKKRHLDTEIKYYGIRKVARKYESRKPLNICEELQNGRSVILNAGIYKKYSKILKRTQGHYMNAYACKGDEILIADPYAKNRSTFYIKLQKLDNIQVKNYKDNEKFSRINYEYYQIIPNFDYLSNDEVMLLNGVISIYPLYL